MIWGKGENWIRTGPFGFNLRLSRLALHWCRRHGLNYSKSPRHEQAGRMIRAAVRKT